MFRRLESVLIVTIAIASVVVTGAGIGESCTYSLSSDGTNFGPNGGAAQFTVNASDGCYWSASDNASWITITSGASGSGTGTVRYTVSANTGPARSGRIISAV